MRRRQTPDGLPYRLYERYGSRTYSIGFKSRAGTWIFRLKCSINQPALIAERRREAIQRAADLHAQNSGGMTFASLCEKWLSHQESMPAKMKGKRASSTLAENRREISTLNKAFGPVPVYAITKTHAYAYLDACALAQDEGGKPRPRVEKGNKEIALARVIFEFGIRLGRVSSNPFAGVTKLGVEREEQRYVTDAELDLVMDVGRSMGGPYHIMALCMKTAFLCVRRSFEARSLTRDMITADGILWTASKRRTGDAAKRVLIEWSPELKQTIDEALACPRFRGVGTFFVFGNLSGQRYTKGGWKANLSRLMARCEVVAAERGMEFFKFSLQECRPKGVSDVLEESDGDYKAAMKVTLHTSDKMIRKHYDRRKVTRAKPVGATLIPNLEKAKKKGVSP